MKTATTSFAYAMRDLGYRHTTFDLDVYREWYQNEEWDRIIAYAKYFDSFDDLPWNKVELIKKLKVVFPNSKWVLLTRSPDAWLKSYCKFQVKQGKPAIPKSEHQALRQFYHDRDDEVRSILADELFLEMSIFEGDGYEKLCPFLGVPDPGLEFPVQNVNRS